MCVAIIVPPGKALPNLDILTACEEVNKDGAGVAWIDGKVVRWCKGTDMHAEDIHEILAGKEDVPRFIHFRIATAGGVSDELCHPFPLIKGIPTKKEGKSREGVLMHNGVWNEWKAPLIAHFPRNTLLKGPWSDTRAMAIVVMSIGEEAIDKIANYSNKVAIMRPDGTVTRWGNWSEKDGVWYSNEGWEYRYKAILREQSKGDKEYTKWLKEHSPYCDPCGEDGDEYYYPGGSSGNYFRQKTLELTEDQKNCYCAYYHERDIKCYCEYSSYGTVCSPCKVKIELYTKAHPQAPMMPKPYEEGKPYKAMQNAPSDMTATTGRVYLKCKNETNNHWHTFGKKRKETDSNLCDACYEDFKANLAKLEAAKSAATEVPKGTPYVKAMKPDGTISGWWNGHEKREMTQLELEAMGIVQPTNSDDGPDVMDLLDDDRDLEELSPDELDQRMVQAMADEGEDWENGGEA